MHLQAQHQLRVCGKDIVMTSEMHQSLENRQIRMQNMKRGIIARALEEISTYRSVYARFLFVHFNFVKCTAQELLDAVGLLLLSELMFTCAVNNFDLTNVKRVKIVSGEGLLLLHVECLASNRFSVQVVQQKILRQSNCCSMNVSFAITHPLIEYDTH